MIVHFERVTTRRERAGKCPVCGKRVQRSRVFEQRVSPFHSAVTPDMSQAVARQAVRDSMLAEADAWEPDFTHQGCKS